MASSLTTRLSREDYKKAKELEELRKTGAAPPEVDEDGKMINPHIPQYISQAPWYLNNNRPGLKHQRTSAFEEKAKVANMSKHYIRGAQGKSKARGKWKKGACENCGAMSHKTKECIERPRRKGAKLTNKNIAADERIQENIKHGFDGKRDRWNGYNPATYKHVINHFESVEKERRVAKKKELDVKLKQTTVQKERRKQEREKRHLEKKSKKAEERKKRKEAKQAAGEVTKASGTDSESDSDTSDTDTDTDTDTDGEHTEESDLDAELKDEGTLLMSRSTNNKHTTNRTTSRNLRIREDTAKYLRNLNIHSAHYDPKTRSMRENPHPDKNPDELMYAGDNVVRKTGDTQEIAKLQLFVWDAAEKCKTNDTDIHVLANPSQAELMFDQFRQKKEALKGTRSKQVIEKYGGQEHFDAPDQELLLAQSEAYVEYSEAGAVIKGQEAAVPKTKYVEDVFESNHSTVWGSFWVKGKWGYACCHSCVRNAYCTGDVGKAAERQGERRAETQEVPVVPGFNTKGKAETKRKKGGSGSGSDGDSSEEERRSKKKKKPEEPKTNKQGYNAGSSSANPTDKEMEAYHRSRSDAFNDPMTKMADVTSGL